MWRLAVIVLALASAAGATPVAITGTSSVGGDFHNIFLKGISSGFDFGNATVTWSWSFEFCYEGEPCDLSYAFHVQESTGGFADFIASDGSTSTGNLGGSYAPDGGPPGRAEGLVNWSAPPLTTLPLTIPTTIVLPITVLGRLRAWTPEELAAHSAPFFDYQITATGTLRAFFWDSRTIVHSVNAEFTGFATPVPEPATWFAMTVLGVAWWWRNRRRGAGGWTPK